MEAGQGQGFWPVTQLDPVAFDEVTRLNPVKQKTVA